MIRALLVLLLLTTPAFAYHRVVSLNLCSDQLLVLLAPRDVAALTPLSRDPALSFVAAQAAHLPVVRADAEAVLRLRPDLVLAGEYGAQPTVSVLRQLGLHVVQLSQPQDFAAISRQTMRVAKLLGVPAQGAALIRRMDATLAALPHPAVRPSALFWEPRGWAPGPASLAGAVLRAAGYVDAGSGRRIGLEALLTHPPDLLVVPDAPRFPSLATSLLANPALHAIPRRTVPPALLVCAGPFTARAAALIAQ